LDDMTEENGTIYVLPYSRAGTQSRQEHVRQAGSNDLVGYHGDDPGIAVVVPAGSIAVFSSTTFHRSGANTTQGIRRVYLPQYSAEPILKRDGSGLWGFAEPFHKNGARVV
jgi:ectoine hydroxylase-related dioxygenase (phytanoyl-CoA dioxygenase family)